MERSSAIEDITGTHAVRIHWDRSSWTALGGKPDMATDTTGKRIYFVYAQKSFVQERFPYAQGDKHPFRNEYEYLKCISFTHGCEDRGAGRIRLWMSR